MATLNKRERKGRLILEEIHFDHVFKRQVKQHSDSSGRIYLPRDLVGKYVYVVYGVGELKNE